MAFDDPPASRWGTEGLPRPSGLGYATDQEPVDRGSPVDARSSADRRSQDRADLERQARTEALYHDAVEDLEAGERDSAQRLFERLVANDPSSQFAAKARRHLAEIYSNSRDAGDNGSVLAVTESVPQRPSASRLGAAEAASSAVDKEPAHRTGQDIRWASPDIELQFIVEAGDRVFFGAGSADLGARARAVLASQARWLKARPGLYVTIAGHADEPSMSRLQQEALAAARAETVRQRLASEGVDPARMAVEVLARDQRVSECDQPECAAQNRRVVTVLQLGNNQPDRMVSERPRNGTPIASGAPASRAR